MYRCTEHITTGFSPYHLMFNRSPKTKLPDLCEKSDMYEHINQNDFNKKAKMKQYADKRNNAKLCDLKEGDNVYLKQRKVNKWSTPYSDILYKVVSRNGNMIVVKDVLHGNYVTRNISFCKKAYINELPLKSGDSGLKVQPEPRPQRIRNIPIALNDYQLY